MTTFMTNKSGQPKTQILKFIFSDGRATGGWRAAGGTGGGRADGRRAAGVRAAGGGEGGG